jgi:hypothetical protein
MAAARVRRFVLGEHGRTQQLAAERKDGIQTPEREGV